MNKRGQLYLLAAILMCLAIYGVVKVQNKIETSYDPDFNFFIDNFKGERTQVVNLGYITETEHINDMSTLFAEFGWSTGIILIQPTGSGYKIYNFRDNDITVCTGTGCQIETGELEPIGTLNFDFGAGKTIRITDVKGNELTDLTTPLEVGNSFTISVDGNIFEFNNPGYKTIIFKDIDENFKKVEVI